MPAAVLWLKRWVAEIAGWALVVAGVAALFLPGPGLLSIVGGLALLSTRYAWANRLFHPMRARAFRLAAEGVRTRRRIAFGVLSALSLVAAGILWGIGFSTPRWWPMADHMWLVGGWATGVTIIVSGGFALALIAYSYLRFRPQLALVPVAAVTSPRS